MSYTVVLLQFSPQFISTGVSVSPEEERVHGVCSLVVCVRTIPPALEAGTQMENYLWPWMNMVVSQTSQAIVALQLSILTYIEHRGYNTLEADTLGVFRVSITTFHRTFSPRLTFFRYWMTTGRKRVWPGVVYICMSVYKAILPSADDLLFDLGETTFNTEMAKCA